MDQTYWLAYRISQQASDERSHYRRHAALRSTLQAAATDDGRRWFDIDGFLYFTSAMPAPDLVARVREAIDERQDLVIFGCVDRKEGHMIGRVRDEAVFDMVPYLERH